MEGLEGEFQGGEPGSAGHRVAGNYLVLPVEGVDEVGTQLYAAFLNRKVWYAAKPKSM